MRRRTAWLTFAAGLTLFAGCHSASAAPVLVRGEIVGSRGEAISAAGLVLLHPDTSNLAVGGRVTEPILSRVSVGKSGVISIRVGFGEDVTKELRRSGHTLNFELLLHDSAGVVAVCDFSRTADSTQAPTKWTDVVPDLRLTVGGGCTSSADDGSTSETSPASVVP